MRTIPQKGDEEEKRIYQESKLRTMPPKGDGKQTLITMPKKRDEKQRLSTMPPKRDEKQRLSTMSPKRDEEQRLSTMPLKRDEEQRLSTMPQAGDAEQRLRTMPEMPEAGGAEQRQMFEHTQSSHPVEPETFLFKGEEILLDKQASYSKSRGGPWKVGSLCLTNKRLFFYQHSGWVFQTAVANIMDVGVGEGRFVLGVKKPLLFLFYKAQVDTKILLSEREKTFHALFVMNDPAIWENEVRKAVVFARMKKE